MALTIWQKISISRTAKKDSRSKYGEYLKTRDIGSENYMLSVYMEQLADNYKQDCDRIIRRRKSIPRLYSKIISEYEMLNNSIGIIDDQIAQLKQQINALSAKTEIDNESLKRLRNDWDRANKGEEIPPETGASTLRELTNKINELDAHIQISEGRKAELDAEIYSKQEARKTKISEESRQLHKYLSQYRYKTDSLYREIVSIGNTYDKKLSYYWRSLTQRLKGITLRRKSFAEICRARGIQIVDRDNLFRAERAVINQKVRQLIGFEVDI